MEQLNHLLHIYILYNTQNAPTIHMSDNMAIFHMIILTGMQNLII